MNISETNILVKALSATQSPVTITDHRKPDNPIVYCNEAFIRLSGYTKDEIIGRNCRFLQGPDTNTTDVARIKKAIESRKDFNIILKNYTKDGRVFWNDLQISPVYNDKGELTHFIGLQNDVTQRIEQERAIAAAKKLESEKMLLKLEKEQLVKINAAKDDFIAVASHQLRTPATAVKQYVGMILEGFVGEFTDRQKDALKVAYENNDRQLKIIDDLLRIARIDTGKITIHKSETNIKELLTSIANEFRYRFVDADINFTMSLSRDDLSMNVDRMLIMTVLENLIDNAIKYSTSSGSIRLRVTEQKAGIQIEISDKGIGMTEDDLHTIFQKFMRSNSESARNIGGTGLGLYWVKTVLDMHNAKIKVISKPGVGTTFKLLFPRK